jgi:hypothetical protein
MRTLNPIPRAGWLAALTLGWTLTAAVPPAASLLPADTLAVLSVPDAQKFESARKEACAYRFWTDPAMGPFREKLMAKFNQEVIEPFEKEAKLKLKDYEGLAQGQVTIAITQNGWTGGDDPLPAALILLDARDKSAELQKRLAEVKQKLSESGEKLKTEKIRDVEFTTFTLDLGDKDEQPAEGDAADKKPEASAAKKAPTIQVSFGQADSLLLVGTSTKALEMVLARLAGTGAPPLAELPAFESCQQMLFRDAATFGWINFAPLAEIINKLVSEGAKKQEPGNPFAAVQKLPSALGVNSLKTLAFALRQSAEGGQADFFVGAPEEGRKGLVKLLTTEAKDAAPPSFVPAEVTQSSRWRGDGQKLWANLESIVNEIMPGGAAFLLAQIEAAVKEKDPGFDFRKSIISQLGDDLISYQKAPRGRSLEELSAPPSLVLVGSPNAETLAKTVKSVVSLMGAELKEREFLGRVIYSLPTPTPPGATKTKEQTLYFAASGGYIGITTDAAMLEDYLRSSESKSKPLVETAGFADAAQKVDGFTGGLFGFQNDSENARVAFEVVKADPDAFAKMFTGAVPGGKEGGEDRVKTFKEWADFSLLPPFEKVSKYFGFTIFGGRMSPAGYFLKVYTPAPPQSRP